MALARAWRAERLATDEDPDGLDPTVSGLGLALRPPRQGRPGRLDGVNGVGLSLAAPGLAVGPVDLDDLDARSSEEPGQAAPQAPVPSTPTLATGPKPASQESRAE
jgi:hypothetical protein